MEKILIIRLSSIGDIVHCSGVPRVLRKKFPHAEISWLVRSDFAELVAFNPHLNQIITFDRSTGFGGLHQLANKLKSVGFTHIYDAHSNVRSRYICSKLKAPHFIRRHKPRLKRLLLFWLRINLFRNYNSVESFIEPLKKWGLNSDGLGSELELPTDRLQKVRNLLGTLKPENTITMAPSAAWPKKRWPLGHWKNLIGLVLKQTNLSVVVLGGPKDDFCKELAAIDPNRIVNLQGKLTLHTRLQLAALSSVPSGGSGWFQTSPARTFPIAREATVTRKRPPT